MALNEKIRLATLDNLLQSVIPELLSPPPSRATLRAWLDAWQVPRFKANPSAVKGGGVVFYSIPHVQRMIRTRTLAGRLSSLTGTRKPAAAPANDVPQAAALGRCNSSG